MIIFHPHYHHLQQMMPLLLIAALKHDYLFADGSRDSTIDTLFGFTNSHLMQEASDEFAPSYLLHRLNRVQRLPLAAYHPFQTVSAEKFAPPVLPNQTIDGAEESQDLRSTADLQPSLHWGAAARAAPLLPPHLGRVLGKSRSTLSSKKALSSEFSMQDCAQIRAARDSSLYATLPAVGVLNAQYAARERSAHANENAAASQVVLNSAHEHVSQAQATHAAKALQAANDVETSAVMAAWISHRKAFDNGSISWDLRMPLYSQELIEEFTTNKLKPKRLGVVADLRARAVQRKANGSSKSAQAVMSDEELMAQKEKIEIAKRNKKAMNLRLGRLIAEEEVDAGSTNVITSAVGKTGTKTNADLEFEALQLRAIQSAREKCLEAALASSSRLRAVGHVYECTESECDMAQVDLRLEAFRSYKLSIPSCNAHCNQIHDALKRTFYFSAATSQDQDFFVYALQNCSSKEPYTLDLSGCSLSETAGSGLGLMMSTPLNQLVALNARDLLISSSSWRFMCDGLRMSRTLSFLDLSYSRGALQSSEGMEYFCTALKKNVSLIELTAHGLPLSVPEHANAIAEAIATHVRLRKLDLSDCSITDFCMNVCI
jgi:hypothetical protein